MRPGWVSSGAAARTHAKLLSQHGFKMAPAKLP